MKSYTSKKTEIRKSEKQGFGFFAIDDIKKDEIVAIRSGHIVELEEAMILDKEVGDFSLQISEDHFLCPKNKEELEQIALYINHSCDPNVGMDGQVNYVAFRDIKAGEELCLDYAVAMNTDYEMKCNCGSKNCRGTVTGFDWKKKELQNCYQNYFAHFIAKMIKDEK
ncbi:MAG: SET domain-containing protein [Desulfobacterales bacterium]|nr:SET domain-containing protein [Desulfobacterales bacterium]